MPMCDVWPNNHCITYYCVILGKIVWLPKYSGNCRLEFIEWKILMALVKIWCDFLWWLKQNLSLFQNPCLMMTMIQYRGVVSPSLNEEDQNSNASIDVFYWIIDGVADKYTYKLMNELDPFFSSPFILHLTINRNI